jgi:hypothetical protein
MEVARSVLASGSDARAAEATVEQARASVQRIGG